LAGEIGAAERRAARQASPPPRGWPLWTALLLLAALLRLPFPAWDGGIAAHPDERFLLGVAAATPLTANPCATSPDFPYGHLPVYVGRLLVLAAPAADPLYAARLLSGLCGVLLVAVTAALGRALGGRRAGLMGAFITTFAPFLIQQARFYTVDPFGALFASLALLLVLRHQWLGAGALAGLAVASKVSLLWIGAPLIFALFAARSEGVALRNSALRLLAGAAAAFAATSPWALLDPANCWRGPLIQAGMAAGRFVFPYTQQYAGTLPFAYPLVQMALWGMGPAALLGLLGLIRALWRWRRLSPAACVLLVWALLYLLGVGGLYAKFPRYLLPLYPTWAALADLSLRPSPGPVGRRIVRWLATLLGGGALLLTALLGLAQFSLYFQPHPWMEASRWIYAELPPGAAIAVEAWEHPLPVPLPGGDLSAYEQGTLPIFAAGLSGQPEPLEEARREAELIVVGSRRGYGALARRPFEHEEVLAWYEALLEEREVVPFGRCPRLGPLALTDDPLADAGLPSPVSLAERCGTLYALRLPHLDESFRVYDAPLTLLLERR
jgi:4-amino-4-deoxy-L-arabinose transferase-like glycosyltransferase